MLIKKNFLSFLLIIFLSFFSFSKYTHALTITQTENVSVSAIVGTIPSIDGGGGVYQSGVKFSGLAYPRATVIVQRIGKEEVSTIADDQGRFSIVVPDIASQLFTLFAIDTLGLRSTLLNFPTILYSGYITDISGIRFAPTIATDKTSIKQGDFITVSGSSLPNVEAEIIFEGPETTRFSLSAGSDGYYSITVPLSIAKGEYNLRISYIGDQRSSKIYRIIVGDTTILTKEITTNIPGDCDLDYRITLKDFSILAYWFGKSNPPKCVDTNGDNVINLVDFSILAFYWTG